MFRIGMFRALLLVVCLGVAQVSDAAQSTADVPATQELKDATRAKILGDQKSTMPPEKEYVIGHGDVLSVSVYGEGDMSASNLSGGPRGDSLGDAPRTGQSGVVVMMDGRISLLHIGDVEVVGMTLTQLADYLKQLYATIYDDPVITTTLVQSNSLRYTVMGNVNQPGIFYLDYPLTIVQVIARSGGFNEWANQDVTVVRENLREVDATLFKENTLEFDYDDFVGGKRLERNIFVRSGDIVIVH